MRKINKYILILAAGVCFTGCTKFDDDINTNPNKPAKVSGTQLIANSEMYLPGIANNAYGSLYPQYLANTTYIDDARYTTVNFNFYSWYYGPLMNLESVINSKTLDGNEGPVENQVAVAKILKAYFFWHLTDRWGDLPYSQALKGSENLNPAYDKQEQIYDNLFLLLDEANATLTNSTGAIKNDIVYGGASVSWKKFANTIHMLMALRLSKVNENKAKTEFNKALNAGIIDNNSANFVYKHLAEETNENYWYTSYTRQGRNWYALSKPLVDQMQGTADPRLATYADKNAKGNYVGLAYGLSDAVKVEEYSMLGSNLRKQTSPVYLVTYAQALFAKAEAAKAGWIPGGDAAAETNYKQAIEASVRQWNNNDVTGLDNFLTQPEVAYTAAEGTRKIATQRWVHLFLNGYESWSEWRRTGFPVLTPAPNNNNKQIPRREGYPTQERLNNTNNYNQAVSSFPYGGSDNLDARVWWDNPNK